MSENDDGERPKAIILYPPGLPPLRFDGDQVVGVGMDIRLGPGVIVRNDRGEKLTYFGMAFALVHDDSPIAKPPGPRIFTR